jgi:DGQHR domain-containing protein
VVHNEHGTVVVPALRALQGDTVIYVMFLPGSELLRVADIRRVSRGQNHALDGFQRKAIRQHVNEIAQYLDRGGRLFPNAIILALEPNVKFDQSRGTKPTGVADDVAPGRLTLPIRTEGDRAAWIVDGQQRSLALEKSSNRSLVVPIVAFETASLAVQREQFILVNRARPLPRRLINELLPDTKGALLPRNLTARQLPSQLCNALDVNDDSPLRGMLRRTSEDVEVHRILSDSAVLDMIRRSLNNPNGALASFKSFTERPSDANAMLRTLIDFWTAVKDTFPDAWGKPPSESRLMHSVGIAALGDLMDRMAARASAESDLRHFFTHELGLIAADCAWTRGQWKAVNRSWDDFQNTPKDIKLLSQLLVQLYAQRTRQ